jgi:hypothetical protein
MYGSHLYTWRAKNSTFAQESVPHLTRCPIRVQHDAAHKHGFAGS